MKTIELNGFIYKEGDKCISCSSEVDKGGRFELKKVKNYFLRCNKCKYTIKSEKVRRKQENWLASQRRKGNIKW